MHERPHVLLSWTMSLDGYLDDASDQRLMLSSPEDFDRVDEQRSHMDAILVGASTVRKDDPRLLVRSSERIDRRVRRGQPPQPLKVTLTVGGDLDPAARFFTAGTAGRMVYTPDGGVERLRSRLAGAATVVGGGEPLSLPTVLADLRARGVHRLLVEGGGTMHTQFLAQGLVDEMEVSVAPFFVGDSDAPRCLGDGPFPFGPDRRMRLVGTRRHGDCAVLRYVLNDRSETDRDGHRS